MVKPYEWMAEYTPQTIWIDGKGIFVWLAEVFGALGGGLYLVSLYFNNMEGMFISWIIIVLLKAGFHLAHLGQPLRFWRLALKPGSSWLARGFIFLALFIGFSAIQIALSYRVPGTVWEVVFKVLGGITAFLVATYAGFVMKEVKGITLWNSAILPLLFFSFGVLGGLAVMIAIGLFGGKVDMMAAIAAIRLLLVINAFLTTIYLWSVTFLGPGGKRSVKELIQGRIAPILWVGVILCGIVIPIGILLSGYIIVEGSNLLIIVAITCIMIGVFSLNYCLLKGGLYCPLVPTPNPPSSP